MESIDWDCVEKKRNEIIEKIKRMSVYNIDKLGEAIDEFCAKLSNDTVSSINLKNNCNYWR